MIVHPQIGVNTEFSVFSPRTWFNNKTFRAYQTGREFHMAFDDDASVVVHELTHYLVSCLPPEIWSDHVWLIEKRHREAGGGDTAVARMGMEEETGWKGVYKVTGEYSSRANMGIATELFGMTTMALKNPDQTKQMLEEDPVQAALALRAMRPNDYRSLSALRPFDKYIPQDAGRPTQG